MNKNIYVFLTFLIISACGGGSNNPNTIDSIANPTVSINSSSTEVLIGESVSLSWESTNATACLASGAWSGSKAVRGSENITVTIPGMNNFAISCAGSNGGNASASLMVEGYRETQGVIVDGYIRQADIFIDTNNSFTPDTGEYSTSSDNDGKFNIRYADGNLISLGGYDLDTGNALDNLLIIHKTNGHSDFKALTPVTSIAAFMADSSLVNAALGIDLSLDIAVIDPVAGKGDSGINDFLYEKGNQLTVLAYALQNITNNLNSTTDTTQDYFKAIAEEVEAEYGSTSLKVDIETQAFITKTLDRVITSKSVTIDETNKSKLISALATVLPIIEVKTSSVLTTAIFNFATSTLQTDTQAIANGSASADILSSYDSDILNYIGTDQGVNSDELAPEITAMDETVSTDEDTSITINVLNNDSYLTSAPISVVVGSAENGAVSVNNNTITYVPNVDFNSSDSFVYTILQGDKTSSATVLVKVNPVNDAPAFGNLLSSYSYSENETASITTITGTDVDSDVLTITLSGTDATSFNFSSENILSFINSPDYETKTSYSITLTVSDSTDSLSKDVSILISNINDVPPVISSAATYSAAENQTGIGSVSASDVEGDTLTYSISGTELAISSAGVITFKTAPDFETKTSYTATVTVSDGVNTATKALTISVTNVNDVAPVITSSANSYSLNENSTAVIGTITASDAEGDSFVYSTSGTDSSYFNIGSSSGVLTLKVAPDYETKASYSFNVVASDGVNSGSKAITLSIANLNDNSPLFTTSAAQSLIEGNTTVGNIVASDADGNSVTYTLSGTNSSLASITSGGVLTLNSNADYETKTSYSVIITATDGTNATTQTVTISVINDTYDDISMPKKIQLAELKKENG